MFTIRKKIVCIGFGSVAQCTLPILVKHLAIPYKNITVIDFENKRTELKKWIQRGVRYVRDYIIPENMGVILSRHLSFGDICIDLAWNIDCNDILQWCHDRGVLYVNTSVELWDPYKNADRKHPTERTLYWRHMKIRDMVSSWANKGPTAVIEHGANPGLISHFTKQGLIDIAAKYLTDKKITSAKKERIRQHKHNKTFNLLAKELGVKVIHVSERDTQISTLPKRVNEFVNTWSVEGFREEGTTTAELGWGTHEKELPAHAYMHPQGPKNQICLARMGMNTWVRSWVPDYSINGMVIRHGEAFTISDRLTVWKNGKAIYRPTVHYAYCPCDAAIASLHELRGNNYVLQRNIRIMNNEITAGEDILGALIMGHVYTSWWTGSILSIKQSRFLEPNQNATTMQVAISVVAAVLWMIEHPNEGVCVPDDLPHDYILRIAKPYLGKFVSKQSEWTPLAHISNHFNEYNAPTIDAANLWQFKNFIIADAD